MMDKNILDPEITLIAQCHTCNEKIIYGIEKCPYCGIMIDYDDIIPSIVNNFVIAQAISSANTIRTFDMAVIFFLGTSLIRYIIDYPTWIDIVMSALWVMPLIIITRWHFKHGRWESADPDYLLSKKQMKWAFKLWLVANAFNIIVIWVGGLYKVA
jgi:hypothetical protein